MSFCHDFLHYIMCHTNLYLNAVFLVVTASHMFQICSFTTFRLDLAGNDAASLSANHLQKLRLSFQLETPYGRVFKPHQVCSCFLITYE